MLNTNPHRPGLLLGALILSLSAAGCAGGRGGASPVDPPDRTSMSPGLLKDWSKLVIRYIDALQYLNSPRPQDWAIADRELRSLKGFCIYPEERDFIYKFQRGDETARKELGRRGELYKAMSVFWAPIPLASDPERVKKMEKLLRKWETSRLTMMAGGEGGPELLAVTLISRRRAMRLRSH